MASDMHIKFEGVEGESTQADHKGWIEILSWSWGVSADTSFGKGTGGAAVGKPVSQDLTFTHVYDKASPVLAQKLTKGIHFPTVTLTAAKTGDGQKDYLTVTMKSVYITSLAPSGGGGGEIHESVSMVFKEVEFAYKPQDATGKLGGDVKFGWNIAEGKVT